jgi:polyvinyl alcohol dehydrogenase (cytochrome)
MKFNWKTALTVLMAITLTQSCSRTDEGDAELQATEQETAEVIAAPDLMEDSEPAPHPGEAAYLANCASCHDQAVYKAPSRLFVSMMGPVNILNAMNGGLMAEQAASLSDDERRAVAEYISGQSLESFVAAKEPPACDSEHGFDPSITPVSAGWGVDPENRRFHSAESGGLTAEDVAELEVKWSFAFPNAIIARSQPTFGGGGVYVGSQDGTVRSLDAKTGCLRWSFKATAEVRTAILISDWSEDDDSADPTLYFGDLLARVYAISARTGELRWMNRVDEHRDATLTGSPSLSGNQLFVPVSSLEVVSALDPNYACCTFRGSVVALNATTGEQNWKTWSIDEEPQNAGTTSAGTAILAPSGAPIWTSPTIDLKRGQLYIGTGENYSSPADGNSDAIIAINMSNGKKVWVSQQTCGDAWNVGCLSEFTTDDANCPEENGPDYDFGSAPILLALEDGRDLVIGGQKSGNVMAIDPHTGETLWITQVGRGGVQGGIHFGMAASGQQIYVPINDMFYPEDITRAKYTTPPRPGLYALNASDGEFMWSSPAPDTCGDMDGCDPGISQAILAIPGAVIAGHMDGRLRIYSAEDGAVLWELNTLKEFSTVSGETARGGSFSGDGGIIADGMLYINSGYGIYNHMPGNVFLAIGKAD